MQVQVLDARQLLVLQQIYPTIDGLGGWSPEHLLEKIHCCPSCSCVFIANPEREEFEEAVRSAKEAAPFKGSSLRFESLEVHGSRDGEAVALTGWFHGSSKPALLGQWHLKGHKDQIPSYDETLLRLRAKYLGPWRWAARVLGMILISIGAYLAAPMMLHPLSHNPNLQVLWNGLGGCILLACAGLPLSLSLERCYKLFWARSSGPIRA